MSALLQKLHDFAESKFGILVLGFALTTVGGSFLNTVIQERSAQKQRAFQLDQERFRQALALQTDLIDYSNARVFALSQIVGQIAHPQDWTPEYNESYWQKNVEPAKDNWNKRRYYFHAQARALFSQEVADLVYLASEDPTKANDEDPEALTPDSFRASKPRSLHGAMKALHATAYRLKQKCKINPKCDPTALVALADVQAEHAELVQRCVLYRLSAELLRLSPDTASSSRAASGDVPPECNSLRPS